MRSSNSIVPLAQGNCTLCLEGSSSACHFVSSAGYRRRADRTDEMFGCLRLLSAQDCSRSWDREIVCCSQIGNRENAHGKELVPRASGETSSPLATVFMPNF